eukprot:943354-Rhodomonas_salina.2
MGARTCAEEVVVLLRRQFRQRRLVLLPAPPAKSVPGTRRSVPTTCRSGLRTPKPAPGTPKSVPGTPKSVLGMPKSVPVRREVAGSTWGGPKSPARMRESTL